MRFSEDRWQVPVKGPVVIRLARGLQSFPSESAHLHRSEETRNMASMTSDYAVAPHEHPEGQLTEQIEYYTSQVPSGAYLGLAFASIGLSLSLQMLGRKHEAQFVGQWVPTILILGLYNKMVKQHGSD
jgi:hypothetical protein